MPVTRRALVALAPLMFPWPAATRGQTNLVWPDPDWQTASPDEMNLGGAELAEVVQRAPTETPDMSELVVVRGGKLVFEHSFGGHDPADAIDIRSITKSVTGLLTGIALDRGALSSLDQPIGEIIPDRIPRGADPNVARVTIRQLLTMTSGIEWSHYTDWQDLTTSDDWVARVLGSPVTGVPGETYVYNTGGSHVLGVTVAAAANMPLEDFAAEHLFQPLGVKPGGWNRSPQGEVNGGSGLQLTARDAARIGLLALRGGAWKNQSIVSAPYVVESTTWQVQGDSTGGNEGYGFQWWITWTWAAGLPAFFGLGYGGQHLFVVPSLDLVIAVLVARRVNPEELRSPRPLIETIVSGAGPL